MLGSDVKNNVTNNLASDKTPIAAAAEEGQSRLGDSARQLAFAPAPDRGEDKGPSGKDVIKTPEQIEKEEAEEGKKAAKAIMEDSAAGKWGETSKKGWQKLFKDIQKSNPDATGEDIAGTLNSIGAQINKNLEKQGSQNRVGMSVAEKDGVTSIRMVINNPGNKIANLKAIIDGKDTDTIITAGEIRDKK